MGTGSGLIFKGSGFYLTDYKKDSASKSPGKGNEKKESPGGTGSKGTTDAPKKE
jgi:predicted nucleic acid-binding Zn ribbon protein